MPQKKNPDPLEVIKGKAGFAQGQLMSLMGMGKSNFIGYNRDSQWTKYIIMDVVNECVPAPVVLSGVLDTMTMNHDAMASWCHKGFIGATTLMEQLVSEFHIPMRQAKVIVEKVVKACEGDEIITHQSLTNILKEEGLNLGISEAQVTAWQDPATIISLTKSYGSPGKNSMKTVLKKLKKKLTSHKTWLLKKQKLQESAHMLLTKMIVSFTKEEPV